MHATSNTHAETALPEPAPGREASDRSGLDRPWEACHGRGEGPSGGWSRRSISSPLPSSSRSSPCSTERRCSRRCRSRPWCFLGLYGILGVYGAQPSSQALGEEDGPAWPVIRVLMAAGFVWSASLITDLSITAQLALARLRPARYHRAGDRRAPYPQARPRRALGPRRRRLDRREAQGVRAAAGSGEHRLHRDPRRRRLETGRPRRPRWRSSTATTPTAS